MRVKLADPYNRSRQEQRVHYRIQQNGKLWRVCIKTAQGLRIVGGKFFSALEALRYAQERFA